MEKKKIIYLVLIIILAISGYYFLNPDKQVKKESREEKISNGDLLAKELAEKYQATVTWEENLIYTIQAQERLITGKPALFKGYISDIFSNNGKTFLHFSSSIVSPIHYTLELECNREIFDKALSVRQAKPIYNGVFNEFAVIANVQNISRPIVADEENAGPSNAFIGKGSCLDMIYIEGDN